MGHSARACPARGHRLWHRDEETLWFKGQWCDEDKFPNATTVNQIFGTCNKVENADYFGLRKPRLNAKTPSELQENIFPAMDAFVKAAKARWPSVVLQWEDWFQEMAFAL